MGVPAFFRWLIRKYPLIVSNCIETPTDTNAADPNPNTIGDREFDNLYLDMNGIIHPCFHPEGVSPPKDEEEIFRNVELYVLRVFNIVRPRRVLLMAIDGVAPRAKMNQQRTRRYRSAKNNAYDRIEKLAEAVENNDKEAEMHLRDPDFLRKHDSNVITPGTPFLERLAMRLRSFTLTMQETDPAWASIHVIISDATVPGEGEHKIMDFVRFQRMQPGYDPNTRHCIYGLDADLIFLGLASHEAYFYILRENVVEVTAKNDFKTIGPDWFHFVSLWVFRQYLERDLKPDNMSFPWDLERALDDFIFVCFAAGNDFIPALPGFSIHDHAIDKVIHNYRTYLPNFGAYLTMSGGVDIPRFIDFMRTFAGCEKRGLESIMVYNERSILAQKKVNEISDCPDATLDDLDAVLAKRKSEKQKKEAQSNNEEADDEKPVIPPRPRDIKKAYYNEKFHIEPTDIPAIQQIATEFVRGMVWTLRYYLKGTHSWDWFYPYYNAPCISDICYISQDYRAYQFNVGEPFPPIWQLMAVLPPQSRHALPEPMGELMVNPNSPLFRFYPTQFKVDLNGGVAQYKGAVHVPFIDEGILKSELMKVSSKLTPEESLRNTLGYNRIFVSIRACPPIPPGQDRVMVNGPLVWGMFIMTQQVEEHGGSKEFLFWHPTLPQSTNYSFYHPQVIRPPPILNLINNQSYLGDRYQNDAVDYEGQAANRELPLQIPGVPPGSTFESRRMLVEKYGLLNRFR